MNVLKGRRQVIWFTGNKEYKVFLNLECLVKYNLKELNIHFPYVMSILTRNEDENTELCNLFIKYGFRVRDKSTEENYPQLDINFPNNPIPKEINPGEFYFPSSYYFDRYLGSFEIILKDFDTGQKFIRFLKILSERYGWKTNYSDFRETDRTGYSTMIIK